MQQAEDTNDEWQAWSQLYSSYHSCLSEDAHANKFNSIPLPSHWQQFNKGTGLLAADSYSNLLTDTSVTGNFLPFFKRQVFSLRVTAQHWIQWHHISAIPVTQEKRGRTSPKVRQSSHHGVASNSDWQRSNALAWKIYKSENPLQKSVIPGRAAENQETMYTVLKGNAI